MSTFEDFYEGLDLAEEAAAAAEATDDWKSVSVGKHYATIVSFTEITANSGNTGIRLKFACLEKNGESDSIRSMSDRFWFSEKHRRIALIPLCEKTIGLEDKFHPSRLINQKLIIDIVHPESDNGRVYPEINFFSDDIQHGMMRIPAGDIEGINQRFLAAGFTEAQPADTPSRVLPETPPSLLESSLDEIPF
tara:strand:+ start:40 stop:615 length:576 start_codon:yes stop_codon:yes gene_type:complete